MDKKKILLVTHEMDPYLAISRAATMVRELPKPIQDSDMDIRILMPRFGTINERRHRLHEVVRLSGINIVVNDEDYPLIIKVASLPGARLQVYFLDNEDYFRRKFVFNDKNDAPFEDNDERMIFFAQGVLETVKKFGWPPNVIHCHGWMTSLIPLYLRTVYSNEPVFENTKIVYSVYENQFDGDFGDNFQHKARVEEVLPNGDLEVFNNGDNTSLNIGGATYADKVLLVDEPSNGTFKSIKKDKIALKGEEVTPEATVELYKSLID
ncbi:MAG: glycogen/starch synthase [Saprospiraceae bacterium]|nr:glycogen/starch synthase [Saprospiraceae bacterium]